MEEVIELARFRVKPEEEQAFLADREAMRESATRRLPGLLRIDLAKLDDGEWIDIVLWKDRASPTQRKSKPKGSLSSPPGCPTSSRTRAWTWAHCTTAA